MPTTFALKISKKNEVMNRFHHITVVMKSHSSNTIIDHEQINKFEHRNVSKIHIKRGTKKKEKAQLTINFTENQIHGSDNSAKVDCQYLIVFTN